MPKPISWPYGYVKKIRAKRPTKKGRNDSGAKQLRAKRPRRNDPRAKRLTGETTHGRFVSDLVGNPEDRFSHNEAQIVRLCLPRQKI